MADKTLNDILDFQPQLGSLEAGPEPSLRMMAQHYYDTLIYDDEVAKRCAAQFITALDAYRATRRLLLCGRPCAS
jgi:hypothetical protein